MGEFIYLKEAVKALNLTCFTPEIDISKKKIRQPGVNRPALQLTGYFEHFDCERLQCIGYVEESYMNRMSIEEKEERYNTLLSHPIPALVFCQGLEPGPILKRRAIEHDVPLFGTTKTTSNFMAESIRWLNVQLAPYISIHGVLVDVYGEGVLITGESGIGKSETALELVKRGHRLVSDDVVVIRKVSDTTLVGSAPDITKHFIELRGIGIVDIKTMFGVSSVKETQSIDLVIRLEEWDREKEYERMGLEESYTEYLGNRVVCHDLPVRPGRNLAIVVESAAVNFRQKKMGYNAAHELRNRIQNRMTSTMQEDDEEEI
ncbi:MAG: HPr(Ser) kinase/phosphatase [Lachnospiraceae bacterium]|nr:HPr(Ser) kinase/phosphatase [Lachnospiraceae bacterium]